MRDFFKKAAEKAWLAGDPARDCSVGLAVAGTLEIVLGVFCFSLAMLLLLAVSATGLHGMKPVHYRVALCFFLYLAAWFIAMGMGSIEARRWARVLVLAGAWVSVFFGTLVMAVALYILPDAYNLLADSGLFAPEAALGYLHFAMGVLALLQVVFPLAAILFYGLKGVEATCARRHPTPCWIERCPLPLLAMGFIACLGSLSVFAGATTNYAVFLFGHVVDGVPGMLALLLLSAAFGYVGWGAFARRMHAWWGAYALVLLTSSSMMLTFSGIDTSTLFARMGYSTDQAAQIEGLLLFSPASLTFAGCAWGIMACIYLVWVRDCFRPEKVAEEVKSYEQRRAEQEAARPPEPARPRMRLD